MLMKQTERRGLWRGKGGATRREMREEGEKRRRAEGETETKKEGRVEKEGIKIKEYEGERRNKGEETGLRGIE